jgi:hypothetical protein
MDCYFNGISDKCIGILRSKDGNLLSLEEKLFDNWWW